MKKSVKKKIVKKKPVKKKVVKKIYLFGKPVKKKVVKKKVVKKKVVKKKPVKKKVVKIDGQDVLDSILGDEYNYIDFLECTRAVLEMDEENCCETFEVREEKSWSVDITVHYKDRGGDEPFPDSPRWDCNSVDVYFMGDGNDFKKWLKKNWKEVYEGVMI